MAAFVGAIIAFVGVPFAAGAPSPLFVRYQQEWHFTDWTLTVAFAIYALTLLSTLLVAGSLSDHIGRRPVLVGALVLQVAAMVIFVVAPSIGWIVVARAVQGAATGVATSTFTATIIEFAPERHRRLGTLISSITPMGALALGALVSGVAAQFSQNPGAIVFGALSLFFVGAIIVLIASPETVSRRAGAVRSLVPRLRVTRAVQPEFFAALPVITAAWMLSGLFLGLAPSIDSAVFRIDSGLVNGVVVALQPATSAVVGILLGGMGHRRSITTGAVVSVAGAAITVLSVVGGVFWLLLVGVVLSGAGIGWVFPAVLRVISPLTEAHQRAEVFAAIYLVAYLAYGAPVLVAGELVDLIGLRTTVAGYGAVVVLAMIVGVAVQSRRPAVPWDDD